MNMLFFALLAISLVFSAAKSASPSGREPQFGNFVDWRCGDTERLDMVCLESRCAFWTRDIEVDWTSCMYYDMWDFVDNGAISEEEMYGCYACDPFEEYSACYADSAQEYYCSDRRLTGGKKPVGKFEYESLDV
mmetsp:Transcript_21862/g.28644  ORF Transcript_21862/g.28644 Transcript_21862/m.28644 type:complete len:134 (+) Transcript_21862:114-515(+)